MSLASLEDLGLARPVARVRGLAGLGIVPTAAPQTPDAMRSQAIAKGAASVGATAAVAAITSYLGVAAALGATGIGLIALPVGLIVGAILANELKKDGWTGARTEARDTASKIAQQLIEVDAAYQAAVELGLRPRAKRPGGMLAFWLEGARRFNYKLHGALDPAIRAARGAFPDAFPQLDPDTFPDFRATADAVGLDSTDFRLALTELPWADVVPDMLVRTKVARMTLLEPAAGALPPGRFYVEGCPKPPVPQQYDPQVAAAAQQQGKLWDVVRKSMAPPEEIERVNREAMLAMGEQFPGVKLICPATWPGAVAENEKRQAALLREYLGLGEDARVDAAWAADSLFGRVKRFLEEPVFDGGPPKGLLVALGILGAVMATAN